MTRLESVAVLKPRSDFNFLRSNGFATESSFTVGEVHPTNSMAVRVVFLIQLALIAIAGGLARDWLRLPQPDDAFEEQPSWVWMPIAAVMIFTLYSFPFWGAIAALRSRLASRKIVITFLVGLLLWLTLFIAVLPSVQ